MSDQEDKKFDALLREKYHKELKSSLAGIAASLGKDTGVKEAIEKHTAAIERFVSALSKLQTNAPSVNVETNQDKVVSSVIQMGSELLAGINDLKNDINVLMQPREWVFKVKRGGYDLIDTVTATMNYTKIKALA